MRGCSSGVSYTRNQNATHHATPMPPTRRHRKIASISKLSRYLKRTRCSNVIQRSTKPRRHAGGIRNTKKSDLDSEKSYIPKLLAKIRDSLPAYTLHMFTDAKLTQNTAYLQHGRTVTTVNGMTSLSHHV